MQLKQGTLLHGGTYKIEKVLGQGSFGITYLAEHTALGKKVAIKEFFMKEINTRAEDGSITGMSDGSLSYNYAKKFQKEAMNLSRLDHPNIVRVTDSFGENGTFYYVMDYIDGMNLNDYVKRYAPSEKTAVEIIKEAASALLYMHEEKQMLHLDLKPGNIMRRKGDHHIFLIDFGLSKHYDSTGAPETSTNVGLGTPGYAPIEQSNGARNGEFRPTIDVYALGATLYKLLTRETPPHASEIIDDEDLLADNLRSKGISESLIAFIVKAMMPSAKKRIQTMQEFVDTLPIASVGKGKSKDTEDNDDDKTQVLGKDETEVIPTASTPFEESAYVIEEKYKANPIETNAKATNGDKDAIIALGVMKLRGEGLPQNIGHAHQWFTKAKEQGDSRATIVINQWEALKKKYEPEEIYEEEDEDANNNRILYLIGAIAILVLACILLNNSCGGNYIKPADSVDTLEYVENETQDSILRHKDDFNVSQSYVTSEHSEEKPLKDIKVDRKDIKNDNSQSYYITKRHPYIESINDDALSLDELTIRDNQTILSFSSYGYKYGWAWVQISRKCYIIAEGKKYGLNRADGIPYAPDYLMYNGKPIRFKLFFPPIPKTTEALDFHSIGDQGAWHILGIHVK